MALRPLQKSTLPHFIINVGVDVGAEDMAIMVALTCPQKDCGKTFFIRDGDIVKPTAPCPFCMKTARTDG